MKVPLEPKGGPDYCEVRTQDDSLHDFEDTPAFRCLAPSVRCRLTASYCEDVLHGKAECDIENNDKLPGGTIVFRANFLKGEAADDNKKPAVSLEVKTPGRDTLYHFHVEAGRLRVVRWVTESGPAGDEVEKVEKIIQPAGRLGDVVAAARDAISDNIEQIKECQHVDSLRNGELCEYIADLAAEALVVFESK